MNFGYRREAALRSDCDQNAARIGNCNTRPAGSLWALGAITLGLLAGCSSSSGHGAGSSSASSSAGGSLFTTTNNATGGGGTGGQVIAELELALQNSTSFVLRGTIPVPKGTYPRKDGKVPFSIRNWDGQVVPTQVEIVSRYPKDSDGADVVEVLGRVDVAPGAGFESRLRYEVVENPHPLGKMPIKTEVLGLVSKPGSVLVVANDVFGNQYGLDVFEGVRMDVGGGKSSLLRRGSAAVTFRTYDVMKPATKSLGAPSGALNHLFGVHAYSTAWRQSSTLSLDLRINNGASGLDKSTKDDDPLGKVYFESLEVWVPQGWTVLQDVEDPMFGTPYPSGTWTVFPIVRPKTDGTMHMMPSQAMMNRRLAITKIGNEAEARAQLNEESLAFCRRGQSAAGKELYSWWNSATARYFPQNHRLPELDYLNTGSITGKLFGMHKNLANHIKNGTGTGSYPYIDGVLGWAHPYGVPYGGMTGGSEVFLYDGILAAEVGSTYGYRHAQLLHRNYASRQPTALYNQDGQPTNVEQWVIKGSQFSYIPMNFFLQLLGGNDPFGLKSSPGYQRTYVASVDKIPGYANQLLKYMPIDFQHYVRYTRSPKVLTWLGNDALAKDDLRMASELFRLSFNEHYNGPGGSPIVSGLRADMNYIANNPNIGFTFGRGEGWGLDASVAAFATGDLAWRAQARPWFATVADTITNGSGSCNGFLQATVAPKMLGNKFRARQSIEQAITENMLYGMLGTVFEGADPTRYAQIDFVLGESLRAMIGPLAWNSQMNGPHSIGAVGNLAGQQFCSSLPSGGYGNGIDKYQTWSSFAYGYEKTGDSTFLTRASEMAGGGGTLWNKMVAKGFKDLHNTAALIADLQ